MSSALWLCYGCECAAGGEGAVALLLIFVVDVVSAMAEVGVGSWAVYFWGLGWCVMGGVGVRRLWSVGGRSSVCVVCIVCALGVLCVHWGYYVCVGGIFRAWMVCRLRWWCCYCTARLHLHRTSHTF